jgi:asparagine synthase (glutamine-hydrolysing)
VEVGAFLSGGIDSTAIGYAVCEQTAGKLKTFNIRFPSEGYFDESGPAKKVAAALGTDHYVEDVTPDAVGILQSVVHHYDDPYADSSAIPTMYLACMTAKHVKVSLSGTGADDTLAGYRRYYANRIARAVSHCLVDVALPSRTASSV